MDGTNVTLRSEHLDSFLRAEMSRGRDALNRARDGLDISAEAAYGFRYTQAQLTRAIAHAINCLSVLRDQGDGDSFTLPNVDAMKAVLDKITEQIEETHKKRTATNAKGKAHKNA